MLAAAFAVELAGMDISVERRAECEAYIAFSGIRLNLMSDDDKAKVPVGEPGRDVSTNVRSPSGSVLLMSRFRHRCRQYYHSSHRRNSNTKVILVQELPEEIDGSWRRGEVYFVVRDATLRPSNTWRHGAELLKALKQKYTGLLPGGPIIFKLRTDGGPDQNMSFWSVILRDIAPFRKTRVPNQSFVNEVEGVMPLVNMALQNVALEADSMTAAFEQLI